MTTSSARPDDLDLFSRRSSRWDDAVERRVVSLGNALQRLRSSRSEGVGAVPPLDEEAGRLVGASRTLADEVALIAAAFRAADASSAADSGSGATVVTVADADLDRARRMEALRQHMHAFQAADTPFDLLSNLRPMAPSAWHAAIHGASCPSLGPHAYYGGGGVVVGPDGRSYPIVVLNLVQGPDVFNADYLLGPNDQGVASLGGADPGWVVVGQRIGVTQHRATPNAWESFAVAAAGTNPQVQFERRPLPESGYDLLEIGPSGWPSINHSLPPVSGGPPEAPPSMSAVASPVFVMVDGQMVEVDRMDRTAGNRALRRSSHAPPNPAAQRVAGGFAGVDLASQLLAGVSLAQDHRNVNTYKYQVSFEENLDGRLRAQVRTYGLAADPDGRIVVSPALMHLDGSAPQRTPVRFRQWTPAFESSDRPYQVAQ